MRTFSLKQTIWLPQPRGKIFAFFSNPGNLDSLTAPEQVGRFDGDIESWIVARTLRAAHPINNTVAAAVRGARTAPCYARIKLQRFEAVHV